MQFLEFVQQIMLWYFGLEEKNSTAHQKNLEEHHLNEEHLLFELRFPLSLLFRNKLDLILNFNYKKCLNWKFLNFPIL